MIGEEGYTPCNKETLGLFGMAWSLDDWLGGCKPCHKETLGLFIARDGLEPG